MDFKVKDPDNLTELDCENIEGSLNDLSRQFGVDHWFEWTVDLSDPRGAFSYTPRNVPQVPLIFDMAADEIIQMVCAEYGLRIWPLA